MKMDKDQLFRTIVRMMADQMDLSTTQMHQGLNILTNMFQNIELVCEKELPATFDNTNEMLIKNYLGCKRMQGCSESTLKAYYNTLITFERYSKKEFIHVDTNLIRRFLMDYESRVRRTTADNCRRNLNTFFQFLEDENYIAKNPCRRIPKIKDDSRIKRFYNDMEIETMRDCCNTKRELALVDLLISTGLRVSEVPKIRIDEIDWEQRTILIHGKGGKDRIVPFSTRCKKHLLEYIEDPSHGSSNYIFCSSHSPHYQLRKESVQQIIKTVGKRANLPQITVHCFRRWFATDLNKKGVEPAVIQQLLGHESFATTQKHYLDNPISKTIMAHNIYAA